MSADRAAWLAARERAAVEKARARASFQRLKAAARPSAIVGRAGRKVRRGVAAAGSSAVDTVRSHPIAATALVTSAGLMLAARPIGEFLADEFADDPDIGTQRDEG